jgi:hypothetical protein
MRVREPELFERFARCLVVGVVPGKQRLCAELVEGVGDHRLPGFDRVTETPARRAKVETELWGTRLSRFETAAADVQAIVQKYGPIGKAVLDLSSDLQGQSCTDLRFTERSADERGDARLARVRSPGPIASTISGSTT